MISSADVLHRWIMYIDRTKRAVEHPAPARRQLLYSGERLSAAILRYTCINSTDYVQGGTVITPDDLCSIQRRYATMLTTANQIQAYQLACAARHDVPRLIIALQHTQAERDAALAEAARLQAALARYQQHPLQPLLDQWQRWWHWIRTHKPAVLHP